MRTGQDEIRRGGLIHPFGNENVYNAVAGLQRAGILKTFETCLFLPDRFEFRTHPDVDRSHVRQHPLHEVLRLVACYSRVFARPGRSQAAADYVAAKLDSVVGRAVRAEDAFWYCYEDGALAVLRSAKREGVPTLYELPAPFFTHSLPIYRKELEEYPALERFFPQMNEPEKKAERKWEELRLADTVICASAFTAESVESAMPGKARVIVGYGGEDPTVDVPEKGPGGRLRIGFAGLLGPRKGLHRLFEALDELGSDNWSLSLVGSWVPGFEGFLKDRFPRVRYRYHGQQPRSHVRAIFRECDVLVLPSLSDGYGLVLSEAMAHGAGIIGSTHTAAPDLLGRRAGTGVVQAGSTEDIQVQLERFIREPEALFAHRTECLQAVRRRPWSVYGEELAMVVRQRMRGCKAG